MRTIKASEVRKGMRVRVERKYGDPGPCETVETIEGQVTRSEGDGLLEFANGARRFLDEDHPVTVLAEPEPEWVEGAWYWVQVPPHRRMLRRVATGWTPVSEGETRHYPDSDELTVLGRVLIVDWPGDDVAQAIERTYTPGGKWIATENTAAQIIANAIRTQGGAP